MTGITLGLRHTSAVLLLAVFSAACRAQPPSSTAIPEIVTDRPDVTESGVVVPKGSLQVENGITWTSGHGANTTDLSETLMRFGVSARTEIRIVAPNYLGGLSSPGTASGFGDLALGMKQQLGPLPGGFDLSVIAAVSLPTGADRVSSHGFGPFRQASVVQRPSKPDGPSAACALHFLEHGEDGKRNLTGEQTFYIEKELMKA